MSPSLKRQPKRAIQKKRKMMERKKPRKMIKKKKKMLRRLIKKRRKTKIKKPRRARKTMPRRLKDLIASMMSRNQFQFQLRITHLLELLPNPRPKREIETKMLRSLRMPRKNSRLLIRYIMRRLTASRASARKQNQHQSQLPRKQKSIPKMIPPLTNPRRDQRMPRRKSKRRRMLSRSPRMKRDLISQLRRQHPRKMISSLMLRLLLPLLLTEKRKKPKLPLLLKIDTLLRSLMRRKLRKHGTLICNTNPRLLPRKSRLILPLPEKTIKIPLTQISSRPQRPLTHGPQTCPPIIKREDSQHLENGDPLNREMD